MASIRFVEFGAAVARCRTDGAPERATAVRFAQGTCAAPAASTARAQAIARAQAGAPPGRVISGGRFVDAGLRTALLGALPAALAGSLRDGFEWYACRGAHFHTDSHYGGVLFGAWCLAGPLRDLAFARSGQRAPAGAGDLVVFDPFEPHAVLDRGQVRYAPTHYAAAAVSVFVGFELELGDETRCAFGIRTGLADDDVPRELSSRIAVNAETGELG